MKKLSLFFVFFLGINNSFSVAEAMYGDIDDKNTDFPIRYAGLEVENQILIGEITYNFDGIIEKKPIEIKFNSTLDEKSCSKFSGCFQSYKFEFIYKEELESYVESGNEFYDKDGRYLGSLDSEGVRCFVKNPILLPMRARVGASGESDFEECTDGANTKSAFWSLNTASMGRAEFTKKTTYSDGSDASISLIINENGKIFGSKISAYILEDGVQVSIMAKNY